MIDMGLELRQVTAGHEIESGVGCVIDMGLELRQVTAGHEIESGVGLCD